ncbi:unnamed protein product [Thlaspi arvense]|uniref:Uncharacterized protein n=1 Tax=Thlaspi arvense TaxID=13288 RepID=A0AAU9RT69_THLAR|nr:unnamed protein product [Thlaspi arvense]
MEAPEMLAMRITQYIRSVCSSLSIREHNLGIKTSIPKKAIQNCFQLLYFTIHAATIENFLRKDAPDQIRWRSSPLSIREPIHSNQRKEQRSSPFSVLEPTRSNQRKSLSCALDYLLDCGEKLKAIFISHFFGCVQMGGLVDGRRDVQSLRVIACTGVDASKQVKHFLLQKIATLKAWSILKDTLENAYKDTFPECYKIADLGCSSGPNTFLVISKIINTVQSLSQQNQGQEFQIFLNDLPKNDFNTLFDSLPAFYDKINGRMTAI